MASLELYPLTTLNDLINPDDYFLFQVNNNTIAIASRTINSNFVILQQATGFVVTLNDKLTSRLWGYLHTIIILL